VTPIARKTLFITGAASGIGAATARLFAGRGWFTGLFDVNESGLQALAEEIGAEGACWRTLDVTRYPDCRSAVAFFCERSAGRLDVLLNCAGILRMGLFESIPIEEQVKTVEINLVGVIHSIHAALDALKKTPGSRVISMSSASAVYGVPEVAVYSASKFAVRGLTEALDLELERHGITVCDLMPPYVRTPMVMNQAYQAGSVKTLGVHLGPEAIAEVVWSAAHRRKLHWVPTLQLKIMCALSRLLPFAQRPAMKFVSRIGS
jgi:NAD(P)-dependent dehydrogenase (short-subunit alcohol dehydrogenase family)